MLDAAERVFATVGFHEASMDAIAREAKISKPMLYNYFGSKQGIYLAYLSRAGQDLVQRLDGAAVPDGSLVDRLGAGAAAFFEYVDAHRAGWRVLRQELARQGEPLDGEVAHLRGDITGLLSALLVSAVGEGSGAERERLDAFAHAFIGAGESLADWWLEHPDIPVEVPIATLTAMADQLP
jgi:AcrR family transcriptional regulator